MANNYFIKNGTVISVDEEIGVQHNCDILVQDGILKAIGSNLQVSDNIETIDATNHIISPGFVDTHRHAWQTQLKNITSDALLPEYFLNIRNIYGSCYTPEDAYLGNLLGGLESIEAGITSLVDHCHLINSPAHADKLVEGLRDAHVRATWCYGLYRNQKWTGVADGTIQDETEPDWRLEDAKRIKQQYFSSSTQTSLLRFGFAPAEIERYDLATSIAQLQYGRKIGAALITGHISLGKLDRGVHFIRQLESQNLLGPDLLFSHGASLQPDELDAMRANGVALSVTPETEMQMAMGPPIAFVANSKHGCTVGLGCDVACNNPIDMFQQMRLLLQAQRDREHTTCEGVPTAMSRSCAEVLRLATLGGAEAMGLGDVVGSIKVGKRADLVLTKCTSMRLTPVHDPVRALVLYASVADVDIVLVDGVVRKQGGQLVGFEWPSLRKELIASSDAIMERAKKAPLEEIRHRILTERSKWLDQNLSDVVKARLGAAPTAQAIRA
jgi:cytosine/adenosine deaminase-related metal-dependent hydrolase